MLSLTSKTCTKYSMIFFVCSIFLGTLLVMRGSVGIIVKSFHNLSEVSLVFIYCLCFLLSGLSLLFSTGVYATPLKKWTAIVHFGCLYWVLYIFIGFIGIQRYDLIAYLLLTIWLLKKKDQKREAIICLGLPMALSVGLFIEINLVFIYYLCCLLSGLSLLFSTGVHSKLLKRWAAFIHFACVFGVVFIFIGFVSIARFDWLIALIAYLLLSIWLVKTKDQKRVAIICLGLPMILSAGFFIRVHYSYLTSGNYLHTLGFLILLSLSGLVGLILAANLKNENRKVKWVLLGINYFFATYFHIVVWIFGL
ncbi:hypothetical protein KZX31_07420 [Enterococcus hirae]|nr:hypothetical protein [Enterococcus hirae]MCK6146396.1 hypothetical protein [Enterococcus hirae]MCK6174121.1 hypothetical protein [Enterococcus hirae]NBA17866.1 hypothetical protein [Enterococcus hirae]